jgi:hypothetical protein
MKFDKGISKQTTKETRDMYFSDLENGDLFQTEDDDTLFVRIITVFCDFEEYNAVDLTDGDIVYVDEDTKVAKYTEHIELNPQAFVDKVPID